MRTKTRSAPHDLAASRGPAIFAMATFGANVANFSFHAVASRSLGPADYGALTAFLVIATVVTVPLAAMQVSVTRAVMRGTLDRDVLDRICARIALAVGAGWVFISPLLALALRVDTWVAALMGGYLAAAVLSLAPKAILLADDRLGVLAGGTMLGGSIRVGVGWLLLHSGGGLGAAIGAGALAETLTVIVFFRMRRPYSKPPDTGGRHAWEAHVTSVLAIGSIWTLLATDVFLARMFMEPSAAGFYAGTALIARSTLFVPQALTSALFPRLVRHHGSPEVVRLANALVLGSSVAGVAFVLVATDIVSAVLLGGYPVDRGTLAFLGGEMVLLALVNLKIHHCIAAGRTRLAGAWLIVVLAACAATLTAAHPHRLAFVMLAASVAYFVAASHPRRDRARLGPVVLPVPEVVVTAIVPIFNEADRVVGHIRRLSAHLRNSGHTFEILAVDDGSTDDSTNRIAKASLDGVRLIAGPHVGKGAAIRKGMRLARGRYIGFIDADGDIPAHCFTRLLDELVARRADAAVASRDLTRDDRRPFLRRLGSKVISRVVTTTLALDATDTQAGVKVFRRSLVAAVLPLCTEDGFAFDGEFLAFSKHVLDARFVIVPVEVTPHEGSTVRLRDAASVLRATFRVGLAIDAATGTPRGVHTFPHQLETAVS